MHELLEAATEIAKVDRLVEYLVSEIGAKRSRMEGVSALLRESVAHLEYTLHTNGCTPYFSPEGAVQAAALVADTRELNRLLIQLAARVEDHGIKTGW